MAIKYFEYSHSKILFLKKLLGETLLSPLVMCGPHGLKFKKPIELRLPHKGATSDGMAFSLKSSDSSTVGGSGIFFVNILCTSSTFPKVEKSFNKCTRS